MNKLFNKTKNSDLPIVGAHISSDWIVILSGAFFLGSVCAAFGIYSYLNAAQMIGVSEMTPDSFNQSGRAYKDRIEESLVATTTSISSSSTLYIDPSR